MCLQKSPPQFADFVKSVTGQFVNLSTYCRQFADFLNLPLDSLLSYLYMLAEIPPPSLQILWNLPLDSLLSYLHVLAEIPPPSLQILWNLPLDSLLSYLYVLAEIPPQFADFVKSATGWFAKLPICAAEISLSLQIFWNLPLDSLLSYLHVLAEIPPLVCRFSEICHWTVC